MVTIPLIGYLVENVNIDNVVAFLWNANFTQSVAGISGLADSIPLRSIPSPKPCIPAYTHPIPKGIAAHLQFFLKYYPTKFPLSQKNFSTS
ncbi:MAG: hypothetical protein Q4B68_04430 [Bacteroidales bacterium]|nr:hypothetical protein [Bacteroidales bacterium]